LEAGMEPPFAPPQPPEPPLAPPRIIETATIGAQVVSNFFLFCLVFCFAAATDYSLASQRRGQLFRGVSIAMVLQFIMLPFVGFCVIRISGLDYTYGIMLQVVTACPGGAYSNWWCSLFNADLLLSVTSTAVATVLSAGLLPLNLLLYLSIGYDVNAINSLRFDLLLVTVAVVITAVVGGALTSIHLFPRFPACARDPQRTRDRCSHLGNFCGLCLVIFSFIFSSVNEPIWNREGVFYAAVAMPPICALVLSSGLSSLPLLALSKPSRCAITVECTFQNVGIGLAASLALFSGDEAAKAAGVPLYYGLVQAIIIPIFLLGAWKAGWTYAPPSVPFCTMLRTSYQPDGLAAGGSSSGSSGGSDGSGDSGDSGISIVNGCETSLPPAGIMHISSPLKPNECPATAECLASRPDTETTTSSS